jgi:hypothetical protein
VYLIAGLNGRRKDAIVPYAGLSFNNLTLGFSYDANVSQLSQMTTGTNAFEFSLTFRKKE